MGAMYNTFSQGGSCSHAYTVCKLCLCLADNRGQKSKVAPLEEGICVISLSCLFVPVLTRIRMSSLLCRGGKRIYQGSAGFADISAGTFYNPDTLVRIMSQVSQTLHIRHSRYGPRPSVVDTS